MIDTKTTSATVRPGSVICVSDLPAGLAKLREPFPDRLISKLPKPTCPNDEWKRLPKGRCAECGGWHATTQTMHLSYVGHAALTDRLLDADPTWTWEPMGRNERGLPELDESGGLWIKLTVCGVTRIGYGNATTASRDPGNREKELIGDALRNAAMRFGAALDLWHKGDLHGEGADAEMPPPSAPKPVAKVNLRPTPAAVAAEEATIGIRPYDFAEEALAALKGAESLLSLDLCAARVTASKFKGSDLEAVRTAYADRKKQLEAKK